ncbi:mmy [Trypoxylus dichotomus]
MSNVRDLQNKLTMFGQSHLLKFYDGLEKAERESFIDELAAVNFEEINRLFKNAIAAMTGDVEKLDSRLRPIPESHFESEEKSSRETLDLYRKLGLEEISQGRVGVLLMAGGQEEETGRKGMITWYIMTSGPTIQQTTKFLVDNNYFQLNSNNIVIFEQGLLPCFDFDGKILLEDKGKISLAPDGNGGIYRALKKNGVLEDMQKRGIKYVHAHSVDNILIKVADPIFVGYCVTKGADCGVKVVKKAYPTEAVGVVCQVDGQFQVVEYSEITDKTANLRDAEGNLVFNAGNICNHFFSIDFLTLVADEYESLLKLHVAKKKIPFIDDNGKQIRPVAPNGIKIEKFVFDVFQFSNNFVTWEVPRYTEFSALKNSDDAGKDCPSTARRDVYHLHKKYVERAGGIVVGDEIEISPLLSYAGENLEAVVHGKTFKSPTHLLSKDEIIAANGTPN